MGNGCEWVGGWGCRYPDLATGAANFEPTEPELGDKDHGAAHTTGSFASRKAVMLGVVFVLALGLVVFGCVAMVLPGCAEKGGGAGRGRGKGGVHRVKERGFAIEEEGLMLEEFEEVPWSES